MAYCTLINLVDIKLSCLNMECGPHQTLPPYSRLRGHWGRGYLSGLSVTSDMTCSLFRRGKKMFWWNFFPSLALPYLLVCVSFFWHVRNISSLGKNNGNAVLVT